MFSTTGTKIQFERTNPKDCLSIFNRQGKKHLGQWEDRADIYIHNIY